MVPLRRVYGHSLRRDGSLVYANLSNYQTLGVAGPELANYPSLFV
jgi:hypothetical protein